MPTGLAFGLIAALYGLTTYLISQHQYSVLVTVVILLAFVPTVIAQQWFEPNLDGLDVELEKVAGEEDDLSTLHDTHRPRWRTRTKVRYFWFVASGPCRPLLVSVGACIEGGRWRDHVGVCRGSQRRPVPQGGSPGTPDACRVRISKSDRAGQRNLDGAAPLLERRGVRCAGPHRGRSKSSRP